jgi:thymidylate synthase ThyX
LTSSVQCQKTNGARAGSKALRWVKLVNKSQKLLELNWNITNQWEENVPAIFFLSPNQENQKKKMESSKADDADYVTLVLASGGCESAEFLCPRQFLHHSVLLSLF